MLEQLNSRNFCGVGMRKFLKRPFTLIELLVVISIIAILATILMPQLGSARDKATRIKVTSDIKSIATSVVASTTFEGGSDFAGIWATDVATIPGIKNQPSGNAYVIASTGVVGTGLSATALPNTNVTSATNLSTLAAYEIFKTYNGKHQFDADNGFYYFSGYRWQVITYAAGMSSGNTMVGLSKGKKKGTTAVRVVGEYYGTGAGDGFYGIGYSDSHVSTVPDTYAGGNLAIATGSGTADPYILNAVGEP